MKKIQGAAWLVVFIALLLIISISFTKNSLLQTLKMRFDNTVASLRGVGQSNGYSSAPNSLATQAVVEEDSQIIKVVKQVSPSVVSVIVKNSSFSPFTGFNNTTQGIGTGFIVDANGLIMTNSHVVSDTTSSYAVVLKDGTTYDVNKIHMDPQSDIALLEIDAKNLPVVALGDSDQLLVGQHAIAIGNALGQFQNTVTSGVISGIARQLEASDGAGSSKVYENAIQTDAAINPGNSGGPLLNLQGQVVGINVATTVGANNISFAIPVNSVKPILASFLKTGHIVRPYMGVQYQTITKEMATLYKVSEGAYVSSVVAGSPADKAGIKQGDIIVSINSVQLDNSGSLVTLVAAKQVGDSIVVTVSRNGKMLNLNVTLAEAPGNS